MMKVVRHWHRLSIEATDALSLEVLKVGWSFEQHSRVKDVPTHGRRVGLDEL